MYIFVRLAKCKKLTFLFITSRQIELEGCATSQITQNWIVISYLLKFFKQIAIISIEIDCFPRCPITYFLDSRVDGGVDERVEGWEEGWMLGWIL